MVPLVPAVVIGVFALSQLALVTVVLVRGRRLRRRKALSEGVSRFAHAILLVACLVIAAGALDLFELLGEMGTFGVSAVRKEEIFDAGVSQAVMWSAATAATCAVAWLVMWLAGVKVRALQRYPR